MSSWCGGAIALCPLACVVGAVASVPPQGCGSRVLMYTGLGQGGFGEVSLCFWSWLVRRLCGLCVISQGIGACQKLSGGSILDLSKLQDPRTLGYLLIFGLYSKPIAYC